MIRILGLLLLTIFLSCITPVKKPENFIKVTEQLYSGGSPDYAHFRYLKEIGVKSVICVDGAQPFVQEAAESGLDYKHVPIGYGGVTKEQQQSLVKAFHELEKPVYIHCHHGRHRGPAAVAIILRNNTEKNTEELIQFLKEAGTSDEYSGLYRDVKRSQKIPFSEWSSVKVPSVAKLPPITEQMAQLDRVWDKLKKSLSSTNISYEDSARQALLLKEQFVELERTQKTEEHKAYKEIISKISSLENSLKANQYTSSSLKAIAADCKSCHRKHRN